MVVAAMLQNPSVIKWLGGLEPAWKLLDIDSFSGLREPPSPNGGAIQLAADLSELELLDSPLTRCALLFLKAASKTPGLKLTATGNLSRTVVADMRETFDWPDFYNEGCFELPEAINEPDFLALFFIRHVAHVNAGVKTHHWPE